MDHSQEAFGCMFDALGEDFNVEDGVRKVSFRETLSLRPSCVTFIFILVVLVGFLDL